MELGTNLETKKLGEFEIIIWLKFDFFNACTSIVKEKEFALKQVHSLINYLHTIQCNNFASQFFYLMSVRTLFTWYKAQEPLNVDRYI